MSSSPRVSIFSYNVLAQCYVERPWDPQQWAGVVSKDILRWEYRWPLIQQSCLNSKADIICLQEVELSRWEGEIEPFFNAHGYTGVLQNDKNKKEGHPVGVATMYRTDRFESQIADHRSRALLVFLRFKDVSLKPFVPQEQSDTQTDAASSPAAAAAGGTDGPPALSICIANVHLEGEPRRVADRLSQFKSTVKQVRANQKTLGLHTMGYDCVCVCGDFNADQYSSVYKAAVEGCLAKTFRDPGFPDITVTESDYAHDLKLDSAYMLANGREPAFTYASPMDRRVVDFMLMTPATLRPLLARPPCTQEDADALGGYGLPNAKFGSDHLPILCEFEIITPTAPPPKAQDACAPEGGLPSQPSKKQMKKMERQQQKADKKQTKNDKAEGNGEQGGSKAETSEEKTDTKTDTNAA